MRLVSPAAKGRTRRLPASADRQDVDTAPFKARRSSLARSSPSSSATRSTTVQPGKVVGSEFQGAPQALGGRKSSPTFDRVKVWRLEIFGWQKLALCQTAFRFTRRDHSEWTQVHKAAHLLCQADFYIGNVSQKVFELPCSTGSADVALPGCRSWAVRQATSRRPPKRSFRKVALRIRGNFQPRSSMGNYVRACAQPYLGAQPTLSPSRP